MEIRGLELGVELIYPDDGGEIIRCPVCQSEWWNNEEYTSEPCDHLRFVYCTIDPGFVFFAGEWNHSLFEASFERLCNTENDFDEMKAFSTIKHPEVDAVVSWDSGDFPLVHCTTYFGYKK